MFNSTTCRAICVINIKSNKIVNNSGLQAPYLDFMENQYYVEAMSLNENYIHFILIYS